MTNWAGLRTGFAKPRSIQPFLLKKFGQKVCDLKIVQIGEWKVRIAANTYFGQMHNGDITTSAVHGVRPQPRHHQTHAPLVLAAFALGSAGMLSP